MSDDEVSALINSFADAGQNSRVFLRTWITDNVFHTVGLEFSPSIEKDSAINQDRTR